MVKRKAIYIPFSETRRALLKRGELSKYGEGYGAVSPLRYPHLPDVFFFCVWAIHTGQARIAHCLNVNVTIMQRNMVCHLHLHWTRLHNALSCMKNIGDAWFCHLHDTCAQIRAETHLDGLPCPMFAYMDDAKLTYTTNSWACEYFGLAMMEEAEKNQCGSLPSVLAASR